MPILLARIVPLLSEREPGAMLRRLMTTEASLHERSANYGDPAVLASVLVARRRKFVPIQGLEQRLAG